MNDIEILENMRDNIYGAMQFEDDYQVSELEEKEFNALNSAITALKERQADKEKIKELEEENKKLKEITNSYEAIKKDYIIRDDIEEFIKTNEPLMLIADKYYFDNGFLTENFIPTSKIRELIKRLEYDINKTREVKKDRFSYIDKARIKAYITKSKEIKKRLEELLQNN